MTVDFRTAELKKIALCMIVKNEARIIHRCIAAARPLIDYALIVDTGSTDATKTEIRSALAEFALEGSVVDEPWRDFAFNRSAALAKLRERNDIDYALMIDADDQIVFSESFGAADFKTRLSADVINIWTRMGGYTYTRPQLISNHKPFHFKGVLHEFLDCADAFTQEATGEFHCQSLQDSARNETGDKYERDAAVLQSALNSEADPFMRSRYTFYLAQSWRDCGRHRNALDAYLRRAELGYWDQEVYVSLYHAGQMAEALELDTAYCLDVYLRAFDLCPTRAEALHAAARLCRTKSRFQSGYLFARRGVEISKPSEGLFLADWIYRYGMKDEFAILAYWSGRHDECLATCEELLRLPDLPESDRPRIVENADFARAAMNAT
jgi:glycosyltransferase involved in cell wall biosynthesis